MKKLIIFDLDGVLVEAKEIHFDALNEALSEVGKSYIISPKEHLSVYDGLNTFKKLEILSELKNLPYENHEGVWRRKQEITLEKINGLKQDANLIDVFKKLNDDKYRIACCSNSIRKSVFVMLSKLGIIEYFDVIVSNEDVKNAKPHPEMYWKAMSIVGVLPEETLIVEDSPPGLLAASRSNAGVLRVNDPGEVSIDFLYSALEKNSVKKIPKWQGGKMKVLIPMAGAGSRFERAGYTFPKPLIDVAGKPMIQVVVDNLNVEAEFIFVVQKSHREKYNLDALLNLISPGCKIVEVDGVTEGAACTTLLAREYIDTDDPLLMANSDQFLVWDSNEFMYKMIEQNVDGGMVTFTATHPKWSFARVNEVGRVLEVAEKTPISNFATAGVYYWKRGSDYVRYAERMIDKDIRTNGEFYVCPVFNEAIEDGLSINNFHIDEMFGLGTPEDLDFFLKRGVLS